MARLPLEDQTIVTAYDDGHTYDLNAVCAAPDCDQPTQDPHHMWRRSFLGGAFLWVLIRPEGEVGVVVGNVIGLCRPHHDQVEAGSAWITLERGRFCWTTLLSATKELLWQPPVRAPEAAELWAQANQQVDGMALIPTVPLEEDLAVALAGDLLLEPIAEVLPSFIPGRGYPDLGPLAEPVPDGVCPSCKRPLPHPKHEGEPEAKRPRRSWTITVPKDERENGAEVLDELLEASREEMGKLGLPYGEGSSVRYFVLAAALALFVQHAEQLMADA